MRRIGCIARLSGFFFLLTAAICTGQERPDSFCKGRGDEFKRPTMSLEQVAETLAANRATSHMGFAGDIMATERARALSQIDAHVYQYGPLDERLASYYRRQIDKALTQIENTPAPKQGVIIWKMYSSGTIIKSADGLFSMDLCEGPIQDNSKTPEQMNAMTKPRYTGGGEYQRIIKVALYWTPEQRVRLVRMLDVYFNSHRHYDHLSFPLIRDLLAAGKTVVAPTDVRKIYLDMKVPGAERIVVPKYSDDRKTQVNDFGGLKTVVFFGYQDGYRPITKDGYPGLEFNPRAPQNNVYIFKTGGRKILANGDVRNYDAEFLPWLISLIDTPWQPDTCLLVPYFRNAHRTIRILFDPFIIPMHSLEFGHFRLDIKQQDQRPIFNTCGCHRWNLWAYRKDMARSKAAVMGWGEKLYLPSLNRR